MQLPKIWNYGKCFTCADSRPYATRNQFNSTVASLFAKEEIFCSHVLDLDQVHVHFGLHAQMMFRIVCQRYIAAQNQFQSEYSNAPQNNDVSLPSLSQNKYSKKNLTRGLRQPPSIALGKKTSHRSRKPQKPCPTYTQWHRIPCENDHNQGRNLDQCFGVGQTRGFF
jgi:hypothetical protein